MKRLVSLALVLITLVTCAAMLFSCSGDEYGASSDIELVKGANGNWWVGDKDTGVSATTSVIDTEARFTTSAGVEYCVLTLTFSDGTRQTILVEVPKEEIFIPEVAISNGYGGANGIVCLMTDNDSGEFKTIELLDELYVKYGLVGGLGTVVKNLYSDKEYSSPKYDTVAKWQEYLDTGRWKIINHSLTHKTYMETVNGSLQVNEDRLYEELVLSAELLRELFPEERVITYAMTGTQSAIGSSSDPNNIRECERELIAEYYVGGRFKAAGATAFDEIQWNNMPYNLLSRANLSWLLNNIDKAANEGKYFMVYNHYVIEDDLFGTVNESSWTNYSTAKALCERVSRYVSEGLIWNAHFEDAILYMRERETASVMAEYKDGAIKILLTDEMDNTVYNHKLTLKVSVPENFKAVKITQVDDVSYAAVQYDDNGAYVLADILPDNGLATIEATATGSVAEASSIELDIARCDACIPKKKQGN